MNDKENDLIRRSDALAAFAESTSAMPEKQGRRRIEEIPAVDAVEVVRCRECIRWQGKDDGNAAPCSWDWYNKDPDWYCPRGKRRGG